ncbi:hypothetical protein GCM10022409_41600 [Hymenobacter glaciei]|uniref:Outer membrane protein beta-barrel domain-containing protein n=1 Tax=Hymenobacter glaciei TaxID=877209 RepID=A0ABP7UR55_9BACT
MRAIFIALALGAGGLATPVAQAQVSKFHSSLGVGAVPVHARYIEQANPYGYSGITPGYVIKEVNALPLVLTGNLGFDAPLLQFSGGEQSLGISLNAAAGLMGTTQEDAEGFNKQIILDFPEYATYRFGAKASKHSKKDFGVGVGLGYRFCRFYLPFSAPSAMLEGVYATSDTDWFLRVSADLRATRYYTLLSSEGPVESLRLRAFTVLLGKSF